MKWKRVCGVMLLLVLFVFGSMSAMANDFGDEKGKTGSITIKIEDTEDNLSKANIHLIAAKIVDLVDGEFVLYDKYADTGINLNQIQTGDELANAATALEKLKPEGKEEITDVDGIVVMENLPIGVYLVYASESAEYEDIAPTLVSIPMWDDEAGSMIYDIEMLPKHSPFPEVETPPTGDQNEMLKYVMISVAAILVGVGSIRMQKKWL